jgi:anti-sigma factor RsiW
MSAPALSCRELVELVTFYFEGALSRRDRRRFAAHLRACDGCSAYVEQMRETIRLAGVLREEDVDPRARDALLHAFRDWRSGAVGPA